MHTATNTSIATNGIHAGRRDAAGVLDSDTPHRWAAGRRPLSLKIVIVIALVAVVTALFTALFFLYRDRGKGERVVVALAVRVVLSMALIAFLVLSYRMGWIQPMR
jgi:hypothetical protein